MVLSIHLNLSHWHKKSGPQNMQPAYMNYVDEELCAKHQAFKPNNFKVGINVFQKLGNIDF